MLFWIGDKMKGSKEEIKAIDLRSDYKVNPIGIHNVGVWKKPQTECLPDSGI